MIKDFFAEQLARIFIEQVKANTNSLNQQLESVYHKGRLIKLFFTEHIALRDRIFSFFFQ